MKALSVRQPWAELIASGRKTIEVRSKRTHHRGELLIVSGVAWHLLGRTLHGDLGQRGVCSALVTLDDCRHLVPGDAIAACLPTRALVEIGGYAWVLSGAQRVEARPMRGRLNFFIPPFEPRLLRP